MKITEEVPITKPWFPSNEEAAAAARFEQLVRADAMMKITIQQPIDGDIVCNPVEAVVVWTAPIRQGTFQAAVDGADVTGLFQVDAYGMRATASIPVSVSGPVTHLLTVSGELPACLPTPGYRRREGRCNFQVEPPDYGIRLNATILSGGDNPVNPHSAALDIVQGMENVFMVSVIGVNGFNSDVQITCFLWAGSMPANPWPPPAGLTVHTPFTIPSGQSDGFLYITADKTVAPGTFNGWLVGTVPGALDSKLEWFTLTVHPVV